MEDIETEELLIQRISEIDENYVYKTEQEKKEENENGLKPYKTNHEEY